MVVRSPGSRPSHTACAARRSPWADKLGINFADLTNDMFKVVSGEGYLALVGHDTDFQPTEPWCKSAGDRPRMQADWEKRTGRTWLTMNLSGFKNYNNDLDIWMNDGAGSLYAVYDFLRALGVEWYMPGELGEIIPKQADIMVPEVNKTAAPEVRGRSISFVNFFASGVTNDALWYFRLGLNGGSQGGFHTMYVILSDPNTRTNHPEYYALYNGKRDLYSRGGKPCLSSEGFFSNMVEYARAHFDVYPQADEFTVMPGDGYTIMCQCDLCKGKDTPERGWEGTISDYVWGFVNRVAGEIQKSHPGRKIHCAAYGTYLLPPEKIQLHTNITVRIVAPTLGAFSGDPARRPHVIAIRNAWLAKLPPGSMLSAHEQNIQNQPGRKGEGLPIFFMREIAEDLKSWNGKLLGENVEVWQTGGGIGGPGLNHLHYYLTGRLYWDSGQDLDRLLDDYYSRFFVFFRDEMKPF